ncbi:MAG: sigma-70 family RNA polymerase sigma factor [bacterium]|nr:sigma-70 family RNA polymerase sigma factor [bacterium]
MDEFCARIRPGLVQIASFRVGNISREDAEDLAHESLLIFVQKHGEVTASPTAFVRAILYNLIGNYLRKRQTGRFLNGNGHADQSSGAQLTGD